MEEQIYHAPTHRITAPPKTSRTECPFCHREAMKGLHCTACNVWLPSPLTVGEPWFDARKRRKRRPAEYLPQCDGIDGVSLEEPADELDEYADTLDELDVIVEGDQAELPPTSAELESLPWD